MSCQTTRRHIPDNQPRENPECVSSHVSDFSDITTNSYDFLKLRKSFIKSFHFEIQFDNTSAVPLNRLRQPHMTPAPPFDLGSNYMNDLL